MDFKVYKNVINGSRCDELSSICDEKFNRILTNYPDVREARSNPSFIGCRFPGFTINKSIDMLNELSPFVTQASQELSWDDNFDLNAGTEISYMNAKVGEFLGKYSAVPVTKIDSNGQLLPEYNNRYCSKTLILSLTDDYQGGEIVIYDISNMKTTVRLEKGDVMVIDAFIQHEVLPITSGQIKLLFAYYCASSK